MCEMDVQAVIERARSRFDSELHTDAYKKVHSDSAHLDALMKMLDIRAGGRYLDLGTGNGYLAFEMSRRFPDTCVTGLDIASNSIRMNQEICRQQGIANLDFLSYDGMRLPFQDAWFAGVISRYVFHHVPEPAACVQELGRVTSADGFVLISDPLTYDEDADGFVDRFQQLKADGHVHFYGQQELDDLFTAHGFARESRFFTTVSYPRDLSEAYLRLFEATPQPILERYCIDVREKIVNITVKVMNVLYRKCG
jgi:ubiquinone/menaquinone biosynthesis C-methylase UbiE